MILIGEKMEKRLLESIKLPQGVKELNKDQLD